MTLHAQIHVGVGPEKHSRRRTHHVMAGIAIHRSLIPRVYYGLADRMGERALRGMTILRGAGIRPLGEEIPVIGAVRHMAIRTSSYLFVDVLARVGPFFAVHVAGVKNGGLPPVKERLVVGGGRAVGM